VCERVIGMMDDERGHRRMEVGYVHSACSRLIVIPSITPSCYIRSQALSIHCLRVVLECATQAWKCSIMPFSFEDVSAFEQRVGTFIVLKAASN
jgi:hypothetical protein